MTFILVPSQGEDLQVNAWNWRPTLELLRAADVITDQEYELMGAQGCGGQVDAASASRIADVVSNKLININSGERILGDLSVSGEPKKSVVFTPLMNGEDIDSIDLYSATYEWLELFAKFCRSSGGFKVV